MAVAAYQGQVENLTLWNYLNFQFNLSGFVAGPIQRYQEFCRYWMELSPLHQEAEPVLRAYLRIFTGVFKIALVAQFCLKYFDRPYLSRNMIDFWTRFHRTLGFWIRDYLFTPMYKGIAARWPARAASLAFLCYLAAFTLAGIWHGPRWNFVIYGLLNGVGVAAAKLWETFLIKRFGRQGLRTYLQDARIRAAAIFAAVNFACVTSFFFPSDLARSFHIVHNVFAVYR